MCAPSEFFTAAGRSAIGKVGRRETIYNILCRTISFSCEMSHGESGRITVFGANTVWNRFLAKITAVSILIWALFSVVPLTRLP